MRIWCYDLHRQVSVELIKEFNNISCIGSTSKLLNYIKPEDKFICFWNDEDTLNILKNINNTVFPSKKIIFDFADGREKMTRFVEKNSKFTSKRNYISFKDQMEIIVPKIENSLRVVAKVGKEHRGKDKFLLYPGQKLMVKDGAIFEEFIENADSIRILLIGDKTFVIEYHDDPESPRNPGEKWIKNINPVIKVRDSIQGFEDLVEDTLNMSKIIGYDYLAVDYVKNEEKTLALELNIYPGLANDERIIKTATKYWIDKIHQLNS